MAKKRARTIELRKDVIVKPPAARVFPTAPVPAGQDEEISYEDLYHDAERDRRTLETEKRELVDFSSQICSLCLTLTKMLIDAKHPLAAAGQVTIPKFLHEQMLGASITVGAHDDGDLFVKVNERGRQRIHLAR